MVSNFKIYALADRFFNLRYVGLTSKSLKLRLKQHMKDIRHNEHKVNWIKKYGKTISIIEIESEIQNLEEAKAREIYWISTLKNIGCKLLNATDGGDYTYSKGRVAHNKGVYKTSVEIIKKIKQDYKTGNYSQMDLSKKYNISKSSIDRYLKKQIDGE